MLDEFVFHFQMCVPRTLWFVSPPESMGEPHQVECIPPFYSPTPEEAWVFSVWGGRQVNDRHTPRRITLRIVWSALRASQPEMHFCGPKKGGPTESDPCSLGSIETSELVCKEQRLGWEGNGLATTHLPLAPHLPALEGWGLPPNPKALSLLHGSGSWLCGPKSSLALATSAPRKRL